ncbi:hypothetical protein PC129_g7889 [Phytophthora cactorum]|uniref:Uncharacterized protein n=1 Tax=Phytophthora cactorum TaxID=29920 RepID=A0A8T1DYR7_9STRA|nr:hypothetical protein PC117_g8232 [Phytophthora cactorum]KAG3024900.1 hypothetical protein PC120_g6822 [Phytophthora cactorum]KAG3065799.1 hypothetical protein PC121_g11174 [Phytophthora cactorum]KAG3221373.1 hypothetical protein PC129_g7889 [Phytophthora cactorum]
MQVAQVSADYGQGQGQGQARGLKRGKEAADKKQRTNYASCQDEGHWYAERTAHSGLQLKPELARKLRKKQPRALVSLKNSVRRVKAMTSGGESQGLFAE